MSTPSFTASDLARFALIMTLCPHHDNGMLQKDHNATLNICNSCHRAAGCTCPSRLDINLIDLGAATSLARCVSVKLCAEIF